MAEVELAAAAEARPRQGGKAWFVALLVLCNLIWACHGTAVKHIQGQLGPIAITFLPFYVTTLLLAPLLVYKRRTNPHAVRPTWGDWWHFVIVGVGGQVVAQLGAVWGVTKTLASNSAILSLLIPVITAVLASIMLGERITRLRISCPLVGLVGVLLMSARDLRQTSFLNTTFLVGNLLILAACTGSAFYNVYCKGLLRRFQEVEILIFSYITASLASVGVLIWQEPDCLARLARLDGRGWAALAFLAFFMYGTAMLLFFYVLQHVPVTVASASIYLLTVFGVIIPMIVLGERLNMVQAAGAAVVLVPTMVIMKYDPGG
ncbi:MAG: DMT family transporter [Planctomycetes bacterium]|nr:DMT family transporter [Planctomycetota bacterium]